MCHRVLSQKRSASCEIFSPFMLSATGKAYTMLHQNEWCRGGSLPEILNYLPDGGQFSRVPMLIQVQVKFLFQVRVRHIVQYN